MLYRKSQHKINWKILVVVRKLNIIQHHFSNNTTFNQQIRYQKFK